MSQNEFIPDSQSNFANSLDSQSLFGFDFQDFGYGEMQQNEEQIQQNEGISLSQILDLRGDDDSLQLSNDQFQDSIPFEFGSNDSFQYPLKNLLQLDTQQNLDESINMSDTSFGLMQDDIILNNEILDEYDLIDIVVKFYNNFYKFNYFSITLVNSINQNLQGIQTFKTSLSQNSQSSNNDIEVTVTTIYRYVEDNDDKPTIQLSINPTPQGELLSSDVFLLLNRCIFATKVHERFYLDKSLYTVPSLAYKLMDFNTSGNTEQTEFDKFQIALKTQVSVRLNGSVGLIPLKLHIIPMRSTVFNGNRFSQSILFPHVFIFLNVSSFIMINETTQPYRLNVSETIDITSIDKVKRVFIELNKSQRKYKTEEIKQYIDSIVSIVAHNIYGYALPRDLIQLKTDSTIFKQPITIINNNNTSIDYLRAQNTIRYILKDLNYALFSQVAPFLPTIQNMVLPRGGIQLSGRTESTPKYNKGTKTIIIPLTDIVNANPYLFYDRTNDRPLKDITQVIEKYFNPSKPTLIVSRIKNLRRRFNLHHQIISVYVDMLIDTVWGIDIKKWKSIIVDTLLVKFILSHLYFRFPDLSKIWLSVQNTIKIGSISQKLFKTPDFLYKFYLNDVIYTKLRLTTNNIWKSMINIESSLIDTDVDLISNGETNIYKFRCNKIFGKFLLGDTNGVLDVLKNSALTLFDQHQQLDFITSATEWRESLMKYHMYNDISRYMFSLSLLKFKEDQFMFTPSQKTSISMLPKSILRAQLLDGTDIDRRISSIMSVKSKFQKPVTPQKQQKKKKKEISPQKTSPLKSPPKKKQSILAVKQDNNNASSSSSSSSNNPRNRLIKEHLVTMKQLANLNII